MTQTLTPEQYGYKVLLLRHTKQKMLSFFTPAFYTPALQRHNKIAYLTSYHWRADRGILLIVCPCLSGVVVSHHDVNVKRNELIYGNQ